MPQQKRRLLSIYKVDSKTGAGLPGAVFGLMSPGGTATTSVTDGQGLAQFPITPCVCYVLREIRPPAGYALNGALFQVVMDACGRLSVNGRFTKRLILPDERLVSTGTLAFFKVSAETMAALPGAAFALASDGAVIGTAVSDSEGLVDFGKIAPGTYQLSETAPPAGYMPDASVRSVVIAADGGISVDGTPLDGFVVADTPIRYPYAVNYYAGGISPDNLLGTITGSGALGEWIDADLTLFAPAGYQTPGTRSGATYITSVPENNVVSVVYARIPLLSWYVEYYVDNPSPANLLGRVRMPDVAYGTFVTLTQAQLDAYRPDFYQSGVQVGGPVAITNNGQIVQVVYLPLEIRTVTVDHFVEMAPGSGAFVLFQTTQRYAFDGDVLIGGSLAINIGPNYVFSFSIPAQLTVTAGSNEIALYYNRVAA